MKKSILIYVAVLTSISLVAYGFKNNSNFDSNEQGSCCVKSGVPELRFEIPYEVEPKVEFFYSVDSRFIATVTKEKLHDAKSIFEIFPKEATEGIESFRNVKVVTLPEGGENVEIGNSDVLNSAQLNLLRSTDYSTNIYIRAEYQLKNQNTGKTRNEHLIYYITIVPEKEAEFKPGHQTLINYLEENSKTETANVEKAQLKSGKVRFMVSQKGKISNVKLESTSGYTTIDNTMIKLITKMPGKWNPATNGQGEKVAQEFVFSFGVIGC